jgi:hypothetical protein
MKLRVCSADSSIRRGWQAVRRLQHQMDEGRRRRLAYIGFPDDEAAVALWPPEPARRGYWARAARTCSKISDVSV